MHDPDANGAPSGIRPTGDPQDVRIYPFAEDAAYCGSGWHALNYVMGDHLELYESRQELVESLATIDIRYELDGTRLATQRTAPKHELLGDEDPGLWFGVGALLPPARSQSATTS